MAGVFSLTNSSQRIDQAVNAIHSGFFPTNSGFVYATGAQTISGVKTFAAPLISRAGFDASENVSGQFSPHNDGLVNIGSTGSRFGMVFGTGFSGTNAYFGGNVTILGSLNASLNIGVTGLNTISVTGTGAFQNIRVTGATVLGGATTISGDIGSSGNNTFAGTNTFQNTTSFQDPVFFEDNFTSSGTSTIRGATTLYSSLTITGGVLSHNGAANLTGTLSHTGDFYQGGPTSLTGNLFVNGNSSFTGNVTIANGTTTIRSSTIFTTGASASDRLAINQNVDQTGDYNLSGSLRISNNIQVTGTASVDGVLSVTSTGYFEGIRNSGDFYSTGTNILTGANSLRGSTNISGSTRISGDLTIVAATGNVTKFDGYFQPYIIAQGFGTTSVASLSISSFWAASTANAVSPGTGIWLTQYSGRIGEMGLFMTGASNTVANNNNLPLGTYGRVFQLVNVGIKNGSGVWYPMGI